MKPPSICEDVRAFHQAQVIIDLHVDVIIQQRLFRYNISKFHRPWIRRQPFFRHADIPRMLEGGYSACALGVHYWPWESDRGWREALKQADYLDQVLARDARTVRVRTADDIEAAHAQGQLGLTFGLEGAHIINGQLDRVDAAAERGLLYLTLAHFSQNQAATPGLGRRKNQRDGLTELGRALVKRLNAAKVLVDVAHVNAPGVLEACEISDAPVIASHTTAQSVYAHDRGLTDEGLRAIAQTGGVVAVIWSGSFLAGRLNVSTDVVVEHTLRVAEVCGPEHLAFGSDFDGWIPTIPNDIRDCRDIALYTQKLLEAGMSRAEVAGLLGGNLLRVLRAIGR